MNETTSMEKKNEEFLKRLLATFKTEADEHVRALSSGLVELEKTSGEEDRRRVIEMVFREAHSLKGAARAVNVPEIETACQSLENVFSELKRGSLSLSPALFDSLHKAVDTLGEHLHSMGAEGAAAERSRAAETARSLDAAVGASPAHSKPEGMEKRREEAAPDAKTRVTSLVHWAARSFAPEGQALASSETVRISTAKLNALLLQAEELLSVKLAMDQRRRELWDATATVAGWERRRSKIQPEVRALQHWLEGTGKRNGEAILTQRRGRTNLALSGALDFLAQSDTFSESLKSKLTTLSKGADQDYRTLAGLADSLLEDMKKALMLPFASLLEFLPKLVRDLSRDRAKDVDLLIQGAEVEAGRRILEEMKDPLVHLVRNCIDHGIEAPIERERKNKPLRGSITIAVTPQNGDKVELIIRDDGAGIDLAMVRASAVKLGLLSAEEAEKLDEAGTLSLIFQSGISTSPMITDLSGRGLGLAIVREKVEKVGGVVSVETQAGLGTTFRIILPLTLASVRGILVRLKERPFVLPTTQVVRAMAVSTDEIKTVENRQTIQFEGGVVLLVRLADILGLSPKDIKGGSPGRVHVVVIGPKEKRVALVVDEIVNEQEVLVKSLGKHISRVRNVAGAAVLGTGQVVPVLNAPDLMKSAVEVSASSVRRAIEKEPSQAKKKSILVAEDSITARTLLKNILESAGYIVKTAVDGADALRTLRAEEFDLVVSDVDMPRMSGFDLTAKIRAEKKLSGLPVVLVTALESREDRERGMDVGANAYIVKSSFDQSNLLEVLQRLI